MSLSESTFKFVVFGVLEFERPDRVRDVSRLARRQTQSSLTDAPSAHADPIANH